MPTRVCPTPQQLQAFQLGDLPEPSLDEVAQHLESCPRCEALVEKLDDTSDQVVRALQGPRGPASADAGTPTKHADDKAKGPDVFAFLRPAAQADEIGRLANYRVLRLMGKGGMAYVFDAEDILLRRRVALKVSKPELQLDADGWQRFVREARILASIKHDHFVTVYQAGQEGATVYLAMELLPGESVEAWITRVRRPPAATVVRVAREIASGLAVIHSHGIIHRDIKPANIFLVGDGGVSGGAHSPSDPPRTTDRSPLTSHPSPGRVKILDFGLARPVADNVNLTRSGIVVGTPAFMSPEQARGRPLDARSDLFSLGCVLYLLCTGTKPFQGETTTALLTALAIDMPKPVAQINPDMPPALADLVMQMLAKSPAERPQSAQEVVTRLQAIERSLSGRAQAVGKEPSAGPATLATATTKSWLKKRSTRRALLLACLLGAVIIGGAAIANRMRTPQDQPPGLQKQTDKGKSDAVPLAKAGKLPVKVFLLAGQSDMAGRGAINTLDWLGQDQQHGALLQKIKNKDDSWVERDDVWVYHWNDYPEPRFRAGKLGVGYGQTEEEIGPELLFGHVLGDYFENQVLIIKVTRGPMSLAEEARPPSSGGPGTFYRRMMEQFHAVLANLGTYFPDYNGQGYEIAGFIWFQGWNDMIDANKVAKYDANLTNLIKDVRREFDVPNLPVVIGEMGVDGDKPAANMAAFRKAQAAVANRPEFKGNVALVKTSLYWDKETAALYEKGKKDPEAKNLFDKIGSQPGFLYLGSGKIYALIGHGFGETMKELCEHAAGP